MGKAAGGGGLASGAHFVVFRILDVFFFNWGTYMGVSKNFGVSPKSSILLGISFINHPFWGTPILGNIHI